MFSNSHPIRPNRFIKIVFSLGYFRTTFSVWAIIGSLKIKKSTTSPQPRRFAFFDRALLCHTRSQANKFFTTLNQLCDGPFRFIYPSYGCSKSNIKVYFSFFLCEGLSCCYSFNESLLNKNIMFVTWKITQCDPSSLRWESNVCFQLNSIPKLCG